LLYRVLTHPESKINQLYRDFVAQMPQESDPEPGGQKKSLPWNFYMHVENFSEHPAVPQKTKDIWNVFRAVVKQFRQEVEANDSELVTVILPADYQASARSQERVTKRILKVFDKTTSTPWRVDEPNSTIMQDMEQQFIPTLDLLPYFLAHEVAGGAPLYFDGFYDEHLNRDGQKLMSDIMCEWLVSNQTVPLPRP
jgi:hypothetical protein